MDQTFKCNHFYHGIHKLLICTCFVASDVPQVRPIAIGLMKNAKFPVSFGVLALTTS